MLPISLSLSLSLYLSLYLFLSLSSFVTFVYDSSAVLRRRWSQKSTHLAVLDSCKGLKVGGKQTSRLTAMSVAAEFKEDVRWFTTNTNFIRRNGCRHVWIEIQNSFSFSKGVLTQDTDKNANANSDRDRESKCNIRLAFSLSRPTSDCILDPFLKLKQQRQCEKKQR